MKTTQSRSRTKYLNSWAVSLFSLMNTFSTDMLSMQLSIRMIRKSISNTISGNSHSKYLNLFKMTKVNNAMKKVSPPSLTSILTWILIHPRIKTSLIMVLMIYSLIISLHWIVMITHWLVINLHSVLVVYSIPILIIYLVVIIYSIIIMIRISPTIIIRIYLVPITKYSTSIRMMNSKKLIKSYLTLELQINSRR